MKASLETLATQLGRTLAPVYWVSGDEPFQLDQAYNQIRKVAVQQGYTDRQVYHVQRGFAWEQLRQSADSLSLFAEKKILEVRLPSGKPGKDGSQALQEYAERPPQDTILLLVTGKLEAATQRTKWFKAVEKAGVLVQVWPLDASRLPQWLSTRLKVRDMHAGPEALRLMAERVEGNLLAADQEIEKFLLLYGPGEITVEQVQAAVADSARYDVFGFVDEALSGDPVRITRMLFGLRAEGAEPILILWALAREARALAHMARELANGSNVERAMASQYVWDKRKPLVRKALQRATAGAFEEIVRQCAQVDQLIKGHGAGRVWDELLELALQMASRPVLTTI